MYVIKSTKGRYPIASDESIVMIGSKYMYETQEEAYRAMIAVGREGLIVEEYGAEPSVPDYYGTKAQAESPYNDGWTQEAYANSLKD